MLQLFRLYIFLANSHLPTNSFTRQVVEGRTESVNAGKGLVSCFNYSDARDSHPLRNLFQLFFGVFSPL